MEFTARLGDDTHGKEDAVEPNHLFAVSLVGLGISDADMHGQAPNEYGHICPVTWTLHKRIVQNDNYPVAFKCNVYFCADQECHDLFLKEPAAYLNNAPDAGCSNMKILSPSEVNLNSPHFQVELDGYDPVTLKNQQKLLTATDYFVQLNEKVFALLNKDSLASFLARPYHFSSQVLPGHLPPPRKAEKKPLSEFYDKMDCSPKGTEDDVTELQRRMDELTPEFIINGTGSMFDTSMSELIIVAIRECARNRYLYPGKSVKQSVLMYLSRYIRANNPCNTELEQEKRDNELKQFIYDCKIGDELLKLQEDGAEVGSDVLQRFDELYHTGF
jgi:hypothetical protein